ncbi:MAG: alpha-1,2-fucosyltransferase [Hymenobacter sp.]|nr:MAG: alpha-1,2-fucosyltransferase [Hymenobacter sp.]
MITVKLISGLGNQLFQYAMGRQLALTRGTELKFDLSFFDTQQLRSFKLDNFNIQASVATPAEIADYLEPYTSLALRHKIFRRIDARRPKYKRRVFREGEWWVYEPEVFQVPSHVYLDGYWQHYKYFTDIQPCVLDELTLKPTGNESADKLAAAIQANPGAVAVHVRRGDYITDSTANAFMGVLPVSYYQQAMAYVAARVPDAHFYFFSDEPAWVKHHLLSGNNTSVVEVENGTDYLDLDLMSKCAHTIIANSSFSWWGAFLNRNPTKLVVAPRQWVVPSEVNQKIELVLPSWVKL